MSKVISFSISDRYLDKLRTLYPSLTDNLAAKQFITDGLESSLGNSLDDSLDGILDDKVKTLIEAWVDGLLDERLDDAVKKSITSLSERLSRLESRLDDTLDGRLDDMEPLLKREKECSIASPFPNQENVETADNVETDSLFKLALKLDHLDDQALIDAIESQLQDDDNEENYSRIETVTDAIETSTPEVSPSPPSPPVASAIESLAGDNSQFNDADRPAIELTNKEKAAILGIHDSNLSKWLRKGIIPDKYLNKCQFNENKSKIILI